MYKSENIKESDYKKVNEIIQEYNSFLLTTHISPDGDSICSLLSLAYILSNLNKKYNIVLEDTLPQKFNFIIKKHYNIIIPEFINVPADVDLLTQLKENYFPEVIFILDCGGVERLGKFSKYFNNAKIIINIDHHPGNRHFKSSVNLIDPQASSTGEILYKFFKINNYKIDEKLAELIYISIVTDTRFFSQINSTPDSLKIASELLNIGVNPEEVSNNLNQIDANTLKIFGNALSRLKTENNGKIIYSFIKEEELKECKDNDVDGLVELLRSTTGTVVAVLFKELGKNKIKVSMRGKNSFNVFEIAEKFNGGGHIQAAGCIINDSLNNAIKIIISKINEKLKSS